MITGGLDRNAHERFDLTTTEVWTSDGRFTRVADMPGGKHHHCLVAIDQERAVALGETLDTHCVMEPFK